MGAYQAIGGDISVYWLNGAEIDAQNLTGSIEVTSLVDTTSEIHLRGDVIGGSIDIGQIADTVTIDGELGGEITIGTLSALTGGATLTIGENVTEDGSIAVTQLSDDIVINGGIASLGSIVVGTAYSGSSITVGEDMDGVIQVNTSYSGAIDIDQAMGGTIDMNGAVSGGSIEIAGNVTGDIESLEDFGADIDIAGQLSGEIDLDADQTSASVIDVGSGAASGSIVIHGNCEGTIDFAGNVRGEIKVYGDVDASTGSIEVNELGVCTLCGPIALIYVGGLCSGSIAVEQSTGVSLIHMVEGVDGSLTINTSEGEYDANGDIQVGTLSHPLPDIDVTGCITILDDGSGGDGDLNGDIDIIGCHASADKLGICIEGDENGTVTLEQTGCTYSVTDYSCNSGGCQ